MCWGFVVEIEIERDGDRCLRRDYLADEILRWASFIQREWFNACIEDGRWIGRKDDGLELDLRNVDACIRADKRSNVNELPSSPFILPYQIAMVVPAPATIADRKRPWR